MTKFKSGQSLVKSKAKDQFTNANGHSFSRGDYAVYTNSAGLKQQVLITEIFQDGDAEVQVPPFGSIVVRWNTLSPLDNLQLDSEDIGELSELDAILEDSIKNELSRIEESDPDLIPLFLRSYKEESKQPSQSDKGATMEHAVASIRSSTVSSDTITIPSGEQTSNVRELDTRKSFNERFRHELQNLNNMPTSLRAEMQANAHKHIEMLNRRTVELQAERNAKKGVLREGMAAQKKRLSEEAQKLQVELDETKRRLTAAIEQKIEEVKIVEQQELDGLSTLDSYYAKEMVANSQMIEAQQNVLSSLSGEGATKTLNSFPE